MPSLAPTVSAAALESWSSAALLALHGLEQVDPTGVTTLRARRPRNLRDVALAVEAHAPVRARIQNHDAEEICQLAGSGAALVVPTDGGWLAASRRETAFVRGSTSRRLPLTPDNLAGFMGREGRPCIVIEPRLPLASLGADRLGSTSPWARLRALMALERNELLVLLVFAFVIGALSLAVPVAVQVMVNTIAFGTLMQPLVILALLLFAGLALMGAVQVAEWYTVEVLQRRLFVRISEDMARRFGALPAEAHEEHDLPKLSTHFFEVVNLQKSANKLLLDGLALALQTLVAVALLAVYHPLLLAFDLALIIGVVALFGLGRGGVSTAVEESRAKYAVGGWIGGLALRRGAPSRTREDAVAQHTEVLTREWLGARKRHYRRVLRLLVGGVALQVLAMTTLLGLGGMLVMRGEMTLGQLVAAEFVVGMLGAGFIKLGMHLETGFDMLAGLHKLGRVLDLPTVGVQPPRDVNPAKADLRVTNLSLGRASWTGKQELSFTLDARTRLYVDGPEASGKSTLLELLAGLRSPTSGELRWGDTHSTEAALAQLRNEAYLLTRDDLVSASILDNLRMVDPTLDRTAAWAMLRRVGLLHRVEQLPEGIDTHLPAAGGPLSRSERTRLSVACAMLAHPSLLLIDGALDGLTLPDREHLDICEQLLGVNAPWAAVVVSRRAAVRRLCNQSIELSAEATTR